MKDAMSTALDEIAAAFSDSRTDICRLEVVGISQNRGAIGGVVLDQKTLDVVSHQLAIRFPCVTLDVTQVRILSRHRTGPRRGNQPHRVIRQTILPGGADQPVAQRLAT